MREGWLSAQQALQIFLWQRKLHRPQSILELMWIRIYDVGVSGMHRLFSRLEIIQEANCVVAVAGMEGCTCKCDGRSCKPTCDRCAYLCGIWSEFPWLVSTSDYDQFLR